MKNNIRLSAVFAAIAVFVAGVGIETSVPGESLAQPEATMSWATAFPVAQAGFAHHAQAAN